MLAPRKSRRKVLWGVVSIVVLLVVIFAFVWGYYLPSQDVVKTGGGTWGIVGSAPVPAAAGCGGCGRTMLSPGSTFTIQITIYVNAAPCYFYCPGDQVTAVTINGPYTLVSLVPSNFPVTVSEGASYAWSANIQAPSNPGHYALGGAIAVD